MYKYLLRYIDTAKYREVYVNTARNITQYGSTVYIGMAMGCSAL